MDITQKVILLLMVIVAGKLFYTHFQVLRARLVSADKDFLVKVKYFGKGGWISRVDNWTLQTYLFSLLFK